MTTDPAVKAAERLVPYKERDWLSREENERKYRENVDEVAAIIRRHYADQEALLRRAVTAIELALACGESRDMIGWTCTAVDLSRAVLADAARLGITGAAK